MKFIFKGSLFFRNAQETLFIADFLIYSKSVAPFVPIVSEQIWDNFEGYTRTDFVQRPAADTWLRISHYNFSSGWDPPISCIIILYTWKAIDDIWVSEQKLKKREKAESN